MAFQLPELTSSIICGVAGIAAAIVVIAKLSRRGHNLDVIPAVGSRSYMPGFWLSGSNQNVDAVDAIQEGCNKHKSAPFKIYDRCRWVVVVSNPEHIEQVLRAPEEVLSFSAAASERFNTKYTLGREIHAKRPHLVALRTWLPQNIATLYHEIRDETPIAFDQVLKLQSNEWKGVPALDLIQRVVCRTSNRLFVGLPLCRNPDWIDLNIQFTTYFAKAGASLGMFPEFMKPLAVHFFTSISKNLKRGLKNLGPMIEERSRYINEHGDKDAPVPNDLLSWMLKNGGDTKPTPDMLTSIMLSVNFAAIHTTSMSFTQALFYLAANPQYIQPMREEVESIVEREGWSKETLGKMHKVDSFLRECQRFEGVTTLPIVRKALKDFTLPDGTFIPSGTFLGVTSRYVHHEDKFYDNGNLFQPFRFADKHAEDEQVVKNQFASTAINYLAFGHGKHSCPGRFLAASELKTMLAHVIVTYDIKLEDNATDRRSLHVGTSILADPRAKILFRRRVE